MPNGSDVEPVN